MITVCRKPVASLLVAFMLAGLVLGVSGCGCDGNTIGTIKDYIVGFATDVGKWVYEKAATFAEALARAWRAFWGTDLVKNVRPFPDNPLKGEYQGKLKTRVEWGKVNPDTGKPENHVEIALTNPIMVRPSKDSTDWELAPEEKRKIEIAMAEYTKP